MTDTVDTTRLSGQCTCMLAWAGRPHVKVKLGEHHPDCHVAREKALLAVVERMPATWHCCRCHRDFPNRPDSEAPYAVMTEVDKYGFRRVKGDICERCHAGLVFVGTPVRQKGDAT